jgi:hypothetical protein
MSCRTFFVLSGLLLVIAFAENRAVAQTISIFGNAVPSNPIDDGNAVTIGVKFWSSQSGAINGVRFYRAVANPQGYVAKLYSAGGTLLGSATVTQDAGPIPGWHEVDFASPIPIAANRTYIAAYYSSIGHGAWDAYGLTNGAANGPLTASASAAVSGNGVYDYGNVFPSSSNEDSNFYVDVAFAPAAPAPLLNLSFNPPNPSIPTNAPLGSVVATITASWSDGSPFTGTLSFAPPYSNDQGVFSISGNNLIVNPVGPGLSSNGDTMQSVTIVATQ